jgi:hypothetical protein
VHQSHALSIVIVLLLHLRNKQELNQQQTIVQQRYSIVGFESSIFNSAVSGIKVVIKAKCKIRLSIMYY